jgi:hypothetical protein
MQDLVGVGGERTLNPKSMSGGEGGRESGEGDLPRLCPQAGAHCGPLSPARLHAGAMPSAAGDHQGPGSQPGHFSPKS